jgi:hypothetical protein
MPGMGLPLPSEFPASMAAALDAEEKPRAGANAKSGIKRIKRNFLICTDHTLQLL